MSGSAGNGAGPAAKLRLGGMALRNGLLIHGPTSWSAAVRAADGRIHVAAGPKPVLAPAAVGRFPLLRGPVRLAEAFALIPLVRRRLPASRLPFEDVRVVGAMVASTWLTGILRRREGPTTALRESLVAAAGMLPALMALRDSDLAAYHGVEHKAIGAYEQDRPDPAEATKEHERCGSNLIAPLILFSVLGQVALERLLESPGPLARAGVAVGGVSLAVEVFAWSERNPDTARARAFRRPGTEIQRLFATREPTPDQMEVGSAALAEILSVEGVGGPDALADLGVAS